MAYVCTKSGFCASCRHYREDPNGSPEHPYACFAEEDEKAIQQNGMESLYVQIFKDLIIEREIKIKKAKEKK